MASTQAQLTAVCWPSPQEELALLMAGADPSASFDADADAIRRLSVVIRAVLEGDAPLATQVELLCRMMCKMSVAMHTDPLTALRNRRAFLRDGSHLLGVCAARSARALVIFVDVDNLKAVNDAAGHAAGDDLLRRAARALQAAFRADDIIARIGGDEFAVVAPSFHPETKRVLFRRLQRELERVNCSGDHRHVGLSVGVSTFEPESPRLLEHLLGVADADMYNDKCARRTG